MFLKSKVKTADADAENNACTVRVNVLEIRTAVFESVKRSTYRKLCEAVYSSCFFFVDIILDFFDELRLYRLLRAGGSKFSGNC